MRAFWSLLALCISSWLPGSSAAAPKVALLIAHNDAGGRAKTLRYAVSDARKFQKVLLQVSGYKKSDVFLALGLDARQVKARFAQVKRHIQKLRKKHPHQKIVLLVYYSGHARRGQFYLGSTSLSFGALRRFLKGSGASLRLALLDTCGSGRFLTTRGIRFRKKSFHIPLLNTHTAKGEAIITSTGDRENAYEDIKLRGGIFTHFVSTGLRGAADRNGDGMVTLEELYSFVYHRTINRTVFAHSGPQKPHFQTNIQGTGQVILSKLHQRLAKLHFRQQLKGQFFIWDQKQTLYAGFRKRPNRAVRLAMRPGLYQIQWRHGKRIFSSKIKLNKHQIFYLGKKQGKLAYFRAFKRRGPPKIDDFAWVRGRDITPYLSFSWSGGVSSATFLGGAVAGGGRVGVESQFWTLQLGIFGFSLQYTGDPRQSVTSHQLLMDLQLAGGYRFQLHPWSIFAGAYAGMGWGVQHLNLQPRSGLLLLAGGLLTPAYWFHPHFGVVLPLKVGVEIGPKAGVWQAQLAWSACLGLSWRL